MRPPPPLKPIKVPDDLLKVFLVYGPGHPAGAVEDEGSLEDGVPALPPVEEVSLHLLPGDGGVQRGAVITKLQAPALGQAQ